MKTIIILLAILATLGCKAQDKIDYTIYRNTGIITYDNDSNQHRTLKADVLSLYKSLVGTWTAQEDSQLSINIQVFENSNQSYFMTDDFCEATNIQHPDFSVSFEMMIGGTRYDDINYLSKIYFNIGPASFLGGAEVIPVSGFLYAVDNNTLRMEVMGITHFSGEGEDFINLNDYKYETAPAEILDLVPEVLRRQILTFKRQYINRWVVKPCTCYAL